MQRLTFAELWTDCPPEPAVVVDVGEGEALAVAEREGVAVGDGVADGECEEDGRPFALGEALRLAFGDELLAVLVPGLVASSVPIFALLLGDFDGVGFGVALLEGVGVAVGRGRRRRRLFSGLVWPWATLTSTS